MLGYDFSLYVTSFIFDKLTGLDPERYRSTATEAEDRRFNTLESRLPESERYKDATPFVVRCRACESSVAFAPVTNRAVSIVSRPRPTSSRFPHEPFKGFFGQGQGGYLSDVREQLWDGEFADPTRVPDPGAH